ncbi:MAG: hypothetical protein ABW122_16560, partial [Ilumatobacteraceae bacterium]
GGSLEDAVVAALAPTDAVILMDNCEHLVDAVRPCVERLLTSSPRLVLVATSRVRLGAPYEWVYSLPGLSVDVDVVEGDGDAVALFVERAAAASWNVDVLTVAVVDREQVRELCRALDGMALAIELAAARASSLGLDGLIGGLDQRLRLLTSGGGAGRHRSLRDAIAWSYDLLPPLEVALMSAVCVFTSWFDVDAAAVVAGLGIDRAEVADGLARLADHHLLTVATGRPTRYRALEVIRQFGAEQLTEREELDGALERHRRWCHEQLGALGGQERTEAWCERVDQVAAEARAAIMSAADRHVDAAAGDLAERLAEVLFLRGRPAEAQRRYEQAAGHTATRLDRLRLLRLAAGAAASRLVGNDTLRLLETVAIEAVSGGDHTTAADARAWMVIYARSYPGIIADRPDDDDCAGWLAEARSNANGSPDVEATIATAVECGRPRTSDSAESADRAALAAHTANVALVESVALDCLCIAHLARADLAGALEALGRRSEVMATLSLDASTGFQFNDFLLMASEVHLAAGNLARAGDYADTLAELACYRGQDHLAIARRIKVDALSGHLESAVARGERFLAAWERAGRPIAVTLGSTTYAMAMVHGLLGDEPGRRRWVEITGTLARDPALLQGCVTGWAPTLDALVALDHEQPDVALARMAADVDDLDIWAGPTTAPFWRPWYAAMWAEAAVLADHPDAPDRLRRSVPATRENPIATTIVRRAHDLAHGNIDALAGHERTFDELGCVYQRDRTRTLADRHGFPPPAR